MERVWQRKAQGRLFENEFLEAVSKIHPITPFAFYGPIVVGVLGWSLATGRTTPARAAVFFALGLLVWQLMEYALHRYVLHWEGRGPLTRRLHQVIHGYHHAYPDDGRRLVMPLSASLPIALVVGGLLFLVGAPASTLPTFAGIVTGYLWYDFLHWSVHARKPRTAWGRRLHTHHMVHHFADPQANFGISHRWLDGLVGTLARPVKT